MKDAVEFPVIENIHTDNFSDTDFQYISVTLFFAQEIRTLILLCINVQLRLFYN